MFLAVTGMAAAVAAQSAQDLPACGVSLHNFVGSQLLTFTQATLRF